MNKVLAYLLGIFHSFLIKIKYQEYIRYTRRGN